MRRRLSTYIPTLLLGLILYLCSLIVFQPTTASAHAFVIGSDPVDGSTINYKPEAVHIRFNAAISPLSQAQVYFIQAGQLVNKSAGNAQVKPGDTLVIGLVGREQLAEGSYEVLWSAVAQGDGHVTHGLIGFNIGFSGVGVSGTTILGPSTSNDLDDSHALDIDHATGIMMVLWEWFVLIALTFWLGIQICERLVLAENRRSIELLEQARKRSELWQWLCLIILLAGDAILLFLRGMDRALIQYQGQFSLSLLSDLIIQTQYGHLWLARVLLILIAMGWLAWKRLLKAVPEPPPVIQQTGPLPPLPLLTEDDHEETPSQVGGQRRVTRKLITRELITREFEIPTPPQPARARYERIGWLALVGILTLLFALTSPAQVLQPRLSAIFFSWLNLIALALWAGCFAYLAIILLPLFKRKELDFHTETLLTLQKRLTPFMLTGLGIQIVSAFFLSNASISAPRQLVNDPYGITLLALLGLAIVTLLFSLYVLLVLRPKLVRQIMLLPVVGAELPARRVRQLELGHNGRRLKLYACTLAVFGMGMLLCMSLMAYFAPPIVFPNEDYSKIQQNTISAKQTKQLGDLSVTVEILPGLSTTDNTVVLQITDRAGQAVTDAEVRLTTNMIAMDMGIAHATIKGGQPIYAATFKHNEAFDMTGLWQITVQITRPQQEQEKGEFQITLEA